MFFAFLFFDFLKISKKILITFTKIKFYAIIIYSNAKGWSNLCKKEPISY